jgi:signal transduction histidine kinase
VTATTSLRARVTRGAVLWSVGIFAVAGLLTARGINFHPHMGPSVHRVLERVDVMLPLAIVCMLGGFWQLRRGLAGITQLRARLAAVHEGRSERVEGEYSTEVQPLVSDLNALLDHQDRAVKRALAKAGDLAHGLKTPLAILSAEAERVKDAGQPDLSVAISQQVAQMRRQIDYHLAHARAAASGAMPGARSSVKESAESLARALHRLHAARHLAIDITLASDHLVRCQRADLDEMLGNLLDNACKWGRSRVVLSAAASGQTIAIDVEDDGAGLEPAKRGTVLERGVRADEAAPGSGLGLAIVRDLAEVYGGTIALGSSPMGGVRARLTLPRASIGVGVGGGHGD